MQEPGKDMKLVAKLMFRLLPVQILLAVVGAVNGIVSSLFASNAVGVDAMSAVGLYAPINMFIGAVSTMFVGGAAILCGKYMGSSQTEKTQNVFSLDLTVTGIIALVFTGLLLLAGMTGMGNLMVKEEAVQPLFNEYLIGQAIGVLPMMLSSQLSAFLSLENKANRTMYASLIYIGVNVALNFLFVYLMQMEALGLALASSLGMWVFFLAEAVYFISGRSSFHFGRKGLDWHESGRIMGIGLPGAISYGYQTLRGLIVNALLLAYVGSVGLSAFSAANTLLSFVWAVPGGMLAVSRMMISISVGEEDRQTLTDVMRVALKRFVPLMCAISAVLIVLAVPLTRLYYRDAADPVYEMTIWGFRILPLCMPLSVICMHFTCYGQASNKQGLIHTLAVFDGVICVAGFTALLIPLIGMNSVYIANVLNGVVTTLIIIIYAVMKNKRFPRNMEELMVIPEDFGVPESERMDLTLYSVEEVVNISEKIQQFCLEKGIDERRAYLAGLCMEEMAGNVIDHGFTKDTKKHSMDVRAVHKDGELILRIKDDCVAFDPAQRFRASDPDDPAKNIGIRMVYRIVKDVSYQNILGLNVLTMKI